MERQRGAGRPVVRRESLLVVPCSAELYCHLVGLTFSLASACSACSRLCPHPVLYCYDAYCCDACCDDACRLSTSRCHRHASLATTAGCTKSRAGTDGRALTAGCRPKQAGCFFRGALCQLLLVTTAGCMRSRAGTDGRALTAGCTNSNVEVAGNFVVAAQG